MTSKLKKVCKVGLLFGLASLIVGMAYFYWLIHDIPNLTSLDAYTPKLTTKIYDADQQLIGEFSQEARELIHFNEIPNRVIQAIIATEDKTFFEHQGINYLGIIRAFIKNFKAGRVIEGGSTITQQLVKTLLLTPDKRMTRKIKEAYLAFMIERRFTKDEILMLYLNQINFGHRAYGIKRAAWNYFHKHPKDLNLAEISLLVGLPQLPSRYNPVKSPDLAKRRQRHVLNRMVSEKYITEIESEDAFATQITLYPTDPISLKRAPHFVEFIRRQLVKKLSKKSIQAGGWHVETTLNTQLQQEAKRSLLDGLRKIDKRRGYRGPLKHVDIETSGTSDILQHLSVLNFQSEISTLELNPDGTLLPKYNHESPIEGHTYMCLVLNVTEKKATLSNGLSEGTIHLKGTQWARPMNPSVHFSHELAKDLRQVLKVGDVILGKLGSDNRYTLEQNPLIDGALLSIHIPTGRIIAMVGGKNFRESQFNRTYQALRQLGSTFKPIVYAKALEMGLTPNTMILDAPIIFETTKSIPISPKLREIIQEHTENSFPIPPSLEEVFTWKPDNYGQNFLGDITLRRALMLSRNIPTIKLVQTIGISSIIELSKQLGLTQIDYPRDLSLSLGTISASLWNIMKPFSIFANLGKPLSFYALERIKHPMSNSLVYEAAAQHAKSSSGAEQTISPQLAYLMTHLLQSVVSSGSAQRINKLGGIFAGKTGTTNDFMDAFFIGYTPDVLTGVWVGFDKPTSIGVAESGTMAAAPIWLDYMKEAIKTYPIREFEVPDNIEFAWINPKNGRVNSSLPSKVKMAFFSGSIPRTPQIIGGFHKMTLTKADTEALPNLLDPSKDILDDDENSTFMDETFPEETEPEATQEELIFGQYE